MDANFKIMELKTLKKAFTAYLVFNIVITLASFLIVLELRLLKLDLFFMRLNTWALLLLLAILSIVYTRFSKKEIVRIVALETFPARVAAYELYYKKRLLWNSFSFVVDAALFILSLKTIFLYVLLFQFLLSIPLYPAKKLISRELRDPDILFA